MDSRKLTTRNGNLAEDLLDCAGKINALSGILSSLMWHLEKDGDENQLIEHGQVFSEVIQDYAKLIETAVKDNLETISYGKSNLAAEAGLKRLGDMVN